LLAGRRATAGLEQEEEEEKEEKAPAVDGEGEMNAAAVAALQAAVWSEDEQLGLFDGGISDVQQVYSDVHFRPYRNEDVLERPLSQRRSNTCP
jgi:hypothetical protein